MMMTKAKWDDEERRKKMMESSKEAIVTPTHTTVVISPTEVIDIPRGESKQTSDGAKIYCDPATGEPVVIEQGSNEMLPLKKGEYIRILYDGKGIYEALKENLSKKDWQEFLSSDAATWLPKPTCDYKDGYRSYFTELGYEIFLKKTKNYMEKAFTDPKKEKLEIVYKFDKSRIVYQDQYQIVLDESK